MYIYVASPYSDPDPYVREDRYLTVMGYTADLIRRKVAAFSPIVYSHDMAIRHNFPKDYMFWQRFNTAMLLSAEAVHILCMDGWKDSKGIDVEIELCKEIYKRVYKVDPSTYQLEPWL